MKKMILKNISGAITIAILISGCNDQPTPQKQNTSLPQWITSVTQKEYSAVGSAKITSSGLDYAETIASGNAKAKISKNIESIIKTATKSFTQEITDDKGTKVGKVTSDTYREVSANVLKNAKVTQKYIDNDEYLYVMVEATPTAQYKELIQSAKEADEQLDIYTAKEVAQ